jgi:hypothetical protein
MHLPAPLVVFLGILGGILEIVQQTVISMSATDHAIVAFALIVLLAIGVVPLGASALARLIPPHVAAALTAATGILVALQQQLAISTEWHDLISILLALLAAVGIVPSIVSVATAKARQLARDPSIPL